MRLRISKIEERASERPPGYVEAVISRGVIDGEFLEIADEALAELRETYRPPHRPEPPLPSLPAMAWTAAQAAAAELSARLTRVPALAPDEVARRASICTEPCTHYRASDARCALCGCLTDYKTRLRSQSCPAGKW